jgi:tetratricopeptide (TPR) repeat protein
VTANSLRKDASMAMESLIILFCAGAISLGDPAEAPKPAANQTDDAIATTLAVQKAWQQGRQLLMNGQFQVAVETLESQISYINGNKKYLDLLREAYRGYVKELRLGKQDEEAQRYFRRLTLLDRGAAIEPPDPAPEAARQPAPTNAALAAATKPGAKVRLKGQDDPFDLSRALPKSNGDVQNLLDQAESEFKEHHYRAARLLIEQVHKLDPAATTACRSPWAYCKLFCVVEQLKDAERTKPDWSNLKEEIQQAIALSPNLEEYGKSLLAKIDQKQGGGTISAGRSAGSVALQHSGPHENGWYLAESANFRVFHRQPKDLAEEAVQIAERTRANMQQKWFGSVDNWALKCDVYLHATGDEYARATGQQGSPGHSSLKMEQGRLAVRRMDLHCDVPHMLPAVLPHETTHVVLAGEFGGQLLPRWADEGMAVLTEPREKVDAHLANLSKSRQQGTLFPVQSVMRMENYPQDPRQIGAFYAQSVSLVEYLSGLRGPQEFSLFLQDMMRYGEEKALDRHYQIHGFADLERRWLQVAFQDRGMANAVAERGR